MPGNAPGFTLDVIFVDVGILMVVLVAGDLLIAALGTLKETAGFFPVGNFTVSRLIEFAGILGAGAACFVAGNVIFLVGAPAGIDCMAFDAGGVTALS